MFERRKPSEMAGWWKGAQDMNIENTVGEVLTIEEAAEAVRISRRHLHKLMAEGDGPPVIRLGRRKLIRREALNQWLLNREDAGHAAL
jgi:excisionase family DNA binding protein